MSVSMSSSSLSASFVVRLILFGEPMNRRYRVYFFVFKSSTIWSIVLFITCVFLWLRHLHLWGSLSPLQKVSPFGFWPQHPDRDLLGFGASIDACPHRTPVARSWLVTEGMFVVAREFSTLSETAIHLNTYRVIWHICNTWKNYVDHRQHPKDKKLNNTQSLWALKSFNKIC